MEWFLFYTLVLIAPGVALFKPTVRRHVRTVLTMRGGKQRYGKCKRCGGTWEHLSYHNTPYNLRFSCFALCVDCWINLDTPDARLPFYRKLWNEWVKLDDTPRPAEQWEQIEAAVKRGL